MDPNQTAVETLDYLKEGIRSLVREIESEPAWRTLVSALSESLGWPSETPRHRAADVPSDDDELASLTAREREILTLVAGGANNQAIANQLCISEKTVRNHLTAIFDKLGVNSRSQAIVFARDRGLTGTRH